MYSMKYKMCNDCVIDHYKEYSFEDALYSNVYDITELAFETHTVWIEAKNSLGSSQSKSVNIHLSYVVESGMYLISVCFLYKILLILINHCSGQVFLCHLYCKHVQWMTYCEGAILSLTHSLTHSLAHSAVSSMCNRWLCNAGSL